MILSTWLILLRIMLLGFCALLFVLFYFLYCWLIFPLCWPLLLFSRSVMSDLQGPMDCRMPGFPVLHYFLEFVQTHVHWLSDATQPSHPQSPPSIPALNLSQHQDLFQWVGSFHQVAKVLQLQHQSFQSLRINYFDLLAIQGILKSLVQHYSSKASIL